MERQGGSPAPGRGFMEDINLDFSEDLFDNIDDLLDFPTQPDSILGLGLRFGGGANDDDSNVSQGVWQPVDQHFSTSFFPNVDNTSNASSTFFQLPVPEENIDQLEWVATFVDNSFFLGEGNQHIDDHEDNNNNSNSRSKTNQDEIHQLQIPSPVSVLESSSSCSGGGAAGRRTLPISPETIVPGRARSKRGRPVTYSNRGHHRSLVSPTSSIADSEFIPHLLSFVSPTHSSSCCLPSKLENFAESNNPLLSTTTTTTRVVAVEENKRKKKNKLTPVSSGSRSWQPVGVRKCLHCEITKTPQWRAGPLGPKTLCNACGVRHKSGRLFPEYRPAASPTFVPKLHSNSHKRVIEMRSSKTSSSSSSNSRR